MKGKSFIKYKKELSSLILKHNILYAVKAKSSEKKIMSHDSCVLTSIMFDMKNRPNCLHIQIFTPMVSYNTTCFCLVILHSLWQMTKINYPLVSYFNISRLWFHVIKFPPSGVIFHVFINKLLTGDYYLGSWDFQLGGCVVYIIHRFYWLSIHRVVIDRFPSWFPWICRRGRGHTKTQSYLFLRLFRDLLWGINVLTDRGYFRRNPLLMSAFQDKIIFKFVWKAFWELFPRIWNTISKK